MTELIRCYGCEVLVAEDGQRALAALDSNPGIELVLLDLMMPVMDGFEVLRRVRADARFKNLPVIALTAKAMKEDRAACLAAGASDYASKPVKPDRLLALLKVWIERAGQAS